ncbi:hypothetical protein M4914_21915 [Streptomyces somaliensis DSM 40738]|uniref:Cytochrome C oxidase subunit I n=1 Tax=Streptomyces somaliensis (strain ATCC 33201 / DSM 40738 / JCM 12659 / KCTC 9044 / NCTC 11332 / NRRL B-12077 / IP 733) TaxID=1134445 RepID=A0AA44ICN7_STRE0|nr:hypothetical protein [Streptomyces somaliensis]MCQ0025328.1 hypothetical protein [Streptomyces somaliensis DSM 40738]NKY13612.1 hypothetical protein [Streptomyces somaliensis DSM 40738]
MRTTSAASRGTAEGINRIEGYLLAQAELLRAREEGEAFARRMPWLTTAQHEEVARLYAEDRIELSKKVLRAVADRCVELRGEYTARYAQLRQRLLCLSTASLLVAAALCAGAWFTSG